MPRDNVSGQSFTAIAGRLGGGFLALLCGLLLSLPCRVDGQTRPEGEGRVVAVDEVKRTVTLDHGPIRGLMSAMRMEFPVQQAGALQGLQVGDPVRFSLEPRGSEWIVATIEKAAAPSPPSAFLAPDFTLTTVSGASLQLSDLRGKVVLLNFWATWCVPCQTEMPAIEALYQRYKDRGLEVVAVNLDRLSTAGVEAFLTEVKVSFPVVLDPSWSTAQAYRVVGLPTSYLIDRSGRVVVREVGERNWVDDVTLVAVNALLK